jgi:hypothetical protein
VARDERGGEYGQVRRTSSVPPPLTPGWLDGAAAPRLPTLQWRNVVVFLERGLSERMDYVRAPELVLDLARRYPRGVGVLTVFSADVTLPHESVRHAMQEAYARVSPHLLGLTFCVEGTDFRGAALRAALAGVKLALRASYPVQIVSELGQAARGIATHTRQGSLIPLDGDSLLSSVEAARSRL